MLLSSCAEKVEMKNTFEREEVTVDSTHYIVFKHFNGGVTVVNTTKDSLESEYYKSQINVNNKFYEFE